MNYVTARSLFLSSVLAAAVGAACAALWWIWPPLAPMALFAGAWRTLYVAAREVVSARLGREGRL